MSQKTRFLSIDYGQRRFGLAVSDPTKLIATPLTTMLAEKKMEKTALKLLAFLHDYMKKMNCLIERIIIGMPLMMNGKRGLIADEVHHFIDILQQHTDIPIIPWDERLTTVQAERALRESSFSRKKRAAEVDSVAALIILQNYLDAACQKLNTISTPVKDCDE